MNRTTKDLPAERKASAEAQAKVKAENDVFTGWHLQTLCIACGWQGGTFWQVVAEIKRLKQIEDSAKAQGEPHE